MKADSPPSLGEIFILNCEESLSWPRLELMNSIGCLHPAKHSPDTHPRDDDNDPDHDDSYVDRVCDLILFGNIIDKKNHQKFVVTMVCAALRAAGSWQ